MANKSVIETNKLKIGSSGTTGLYVGSTESKYAILTDANKNQTVVYDKVRYDFAVNDLSSTVPASGGTYTITASTSKRTHGNGAVDNVIFSPTSVTVPANTGSSYSSSVTVTQATSNLTDAYNYTVAADSVKSIALTISNPSVIPAKGGSVSSCSTAATVTYHSGRQITTFTPTSVNFNTVSASSKSTTASSVTTAGTLTCYIVFGGVTSNTASVYVTQAKNEITGYTGYSDLAGMNISSSKVPAGGGTSTITWGGTPTAKRKPVYSSTATGSSVSYTPSISTAVTGNSVVGSKGTTPSNETTAIATVTGYYWANGLTASTTTSVKQNANYVTLVEATGYTGTGAGVNHFSYSNISAGATYADRNNSGGAYYTFTSGSKIYDPNSSPSFGGSATYTRSNFTLAASQNGFTAVDSSTGRLTATSLGTTISNARTSANVTGRLVVTYTHASGINGGTVTSAAYNSTATCTQNGNYVTSISVSGQGVAIANIGAGGGSKTPTGSNGTVTYTFSSTSTSTSTPGSTYGSLTSSVSYAMTNTGRFTLKSTSTGEVSATSKGTSIENVTNANTLTKTVSYTWTPTSGYNAAGTKTTSGTATTTPKQDGNYVSSLTVTTNPTLSYGSVIPAGGGSINPSGSVGAVSYNFTSGSNSTTAPTSTYGALTTPTSYAMASGGDSRITLSSTSTGALSGTTKGTTVVGVTSSGTVTKTVTYTWTPSSSYPGGTITKTGSATAKGTQAANAVTGYTDYQTPTGKSISGSQVPANGGTSTITWSGTAAQNAKAVYTSNATASTYTNVAPTVSTAVTGNSAVGSKGTTVSNATTAIATVTGYYWANGKTASTTCSVTQAGNYVTGITVASQAVSIANIPAGGGSKTPTGGNGTVTYAFSSKSTSTSTPASSAGTLTSSVSYAMTNTGRFTLKSTSTGKVSATTKGTTIENVTNANTLTKTVSYTWTPASGYTAAGTKTTSGTATCTPKQDGNYVSSLTITTNPSISYGSAIPAGGGSISPSGGVGTVSYNFTSGSNSTTAPTSTYGALTTPTSYAMASGGDSRITLTSTSNGTLSGTTKGTTVVGETSSGTVTKTVTYTWTPSSSYPGGTITKVGSATAKGTQAANAVTGYTDYQTPTGKSISGSQVPAKGGTSTITWSGTAAQNAKAVYTSNATANTYTNVAPSVSTAVTGNSAVGSKGTTVSNATTAIATVTGYYWANGKTASTTCSVTQAGNYVTGITVASQAVSIANIPAGGGSKTPTGSNGTVTYAFSSTSTSTNTPASSAGTLTSNVSYAMTNTGRFTLKSTSTGEVSATTKGTTIENVTNSNTLTKTVSYTWTPASGYDAAGTKTCSGSTTTTPKQDGNYVASLTITTNPTISYGSAIPAGGGSISPSGGVGAVSYNFTSGSNSTTAPTSTYGALTTPTSYAMATGGDSRITLTSTSNGTLSGTTKGTTVVGITSSGTVTKTVTYTWTPSTSYPGGTVTKVGTATAKGTQAANAVTGYVDYQTPTGKSISGSQVGAGGGTSTITWSGTAAQNAKPVYTSTSTGSSYVNVAPSVSTAITGNSTVDSKGTTPSNVTTALTVTGYYWANGKTASTSCYVTQAANAITNSDYSKNNYAATVSIGNGLTAAGGSATVTYNASHYGYDYYTSGSYNNNHIHYDQAKVEITSNGNNRFSMTTVCGSTASNTTTLSHSTMGTSATTDSVTVKCTNMADTSKTATTSKSVVNQIESYTSYSGLTGMSVSASKVAAAGGTSTITWSGTPSATRKPVYTSTATGSSVSYTPSISTAVTGNSAVSSKGANISNETTAIATVTGYYWANGLTASTTTSVKQLGNYVTGITLSGLAASVAQIPAAGGSKTDSGSDGTVTYTFSSTSTSTSTPASTYGSISSSKSYSMTATGRFTLTNANNGTVSATTKGTTIENVTNANTLTKSITWTWTPTSSYNAAGTKTVTGSTTTTPSQAGNYVASLTYTTSPSLSYSTTIPAAGGTCNPTLNGGAVKYTYTSGSETSSAPASTYGSASSGKTGNYSMTAGNGFTIVASSGVISAETRGTTTGAARTSNNASVTVRWTWTPSTSYNAGGTITKDASCSGSATQAKNEVTSYTDYQNPTGVSITGTKVPAAGGTSTISFSPATASQQAKAVYSSNSTASSYTTLSVSYTTSVTGNSAVNSKGTTISNETTAIASVTGTYTANGKSSTTSAISIKQLGNYVTAITLSSLAASVAQIPAAGGSKTDSGSDGTVTYSFSSRSTSTTTPGSTYGSISSSKSYSMTATGRFTLKNASTGEVSATTKGTTIENVTNANTLTKSITWTWTPTSSYNAEGAKTATGSTTTTPQQAGNYVASLTYTTNPTLTYSTTIPAAGGICNHTLTGGAVKYTYTSGSETSSAPASTYGSASSGKTGNYSMTAGNGFSIVESSGVISAETRGTTTGAARTSNSASVTVRWTWTPTSSYNAGGTITKDASCSGTATQAKNEVTSYTDYQNPTGLSISASKVPAAGGTATISWSPSNRQGSQQAKAVYTSNATASSYTTLLVTCTTAITGNSAVSSKGTTISNETTAIATVTGTYTANGKSNTCTTSVKQNGNYVTGLTMAAMTLSIDDIPAAGGLKSPSLNGGVVTYHYSSTLTGTTKPATTYGMLLTIDEYSMTNTGRFTLKNVNGQVSATSKGTSIENVTNANPLTLTRSCEWTPTSSYSGGGFQSVSGATSCTPKQAGNYVIDIDFNNAPEIEYYTYELSANGRITLETDYDTGDDGRVEYEYTSQQWDGSTPSATYGTLSSVVSYSADSAAHGFGIADGDGKVTASTRGTTLGDAWDLGYVNKTVTYTWTPTSSYSAGGVKSVTLSRRSPKFTQQANTRYWNPTSYQWTGDAVSARRALLGAAACTAVLPLRYQTTGKWVYDSLEEVATGGTSYISANTYGMSFITSKSNGAQLGTEDDNVYMYNTNTGELSGKTLGTTSHVATSRDNVATMYLWMPNSAEGTASTTFGYTRGVNQIVSTSFTSCEIIGVQGSYSVPYTGTTIAIEPDLLVNRNQTWTSGAQNQGSMRLVDNINITTNFGNKKRRLNCGFGIAMVSSSTSPSTDYSRIDVYSAPGPVKGLTGATTSSTITVYAWSNEAGFAGHTASTSFYMTKPARSNEPYSATTYWYTASTNTLSGVVVTSKGIFMPSVNVTATIPSSGRTSFYLGSANTTTTHGVAGHYATYQITGSVVSNFTLTTSSPVPFVRMNNPQNTADTVVLGTVRAAVDQKINNTLVSGTTRYITFYNDVCYNTTVDTSSVRWDWDKTGGQVISIGFNHAMYQSTSITSTLSASCSSSHFTLRWSEEARYSWDGAAGTHYEYNGDLNKLYEEITVTPTGTNPTSSAIYGTLVLYIKSPNTGQWKAFKSIPLTHAQYVAPQT